VVIIKPISVIAQNEAKLKIPMKIRFFHSMTCSRLKEMGTIIPTRTDKTNVVLKDLKIPLFILFLLLLFPYRPLPAQAFFGNGVLMSPSLLKLSRHSSQSIQSNG
jgi:hypothetical protein